MKTVVIDLYGGPGCGKSTLAALLYAELKKRHISVELVREWLKPMAWQRREIGRWDEPYIFAKQLKAEAALYGRVEYIVTDRPLALTTVYERFFISTGRLKYPLMEQMVAELLRQQAGEGIHHRPFIVDRIGPYITDGRYQTEQEAYQVDAICCEVSNMSNNAFVVTEPVTIIHYMEALGYDLSGS